MRVAYFSNHLATERGHGIARYARELLRALRSTDRDLKVVPVSAWTDYGGDERLRFVDEIGLVVLPWGRRTTSASWTLLRRPKLESVVDADVVHAVSLGYPTATDRPLVTTIHDIGPLTHSEFFPARTSWMMHRTLRDAAKRSAALVCNSEATLAETVGYCSQRLEIDVHDRVSVAYPAVDVDYFTASPAQAPKPPTTAPFVLTAGRMSPRKNVAAVVQAMTRLADRIPHHLVIAGGAGWESDELFSEIDGSRARGRIHHLGYVDDDHLRALYQSADAYVHPSLFEGFGLTILEAMAAGCPVVTSNRSSLREVGADAAVLVDPESIEEIASAIEALCLDQALADDHRARGQRRVLDFSWMSCASTYRTVYEAVR